MSRGSDGQPLTRSFFERSATKLAPLLLNKLLIRSDGRAGRIIEVEAYAGEQDPASHAYRGRTTRNTTMFGPAGHLYVYFSYGVHWCANVVGGTEGTAQAVLLRALEPVGGLEAMRAARWRSQRRQVDRDLCRGPGRLCQAMGIDRALDGTDLLDASGPLWLADDGTRHPAKPLVTRRIGISAAQERLWRFALSGHPGVSGPSSGAPAPLR